MSHVHVSNTKRIWWVFALLSVVTTVEVTLGIIRPDALFLNYLLGMSLLNWLFYILTIFKAYYIVWAFMHMEGEKSSLKWAVVLPLLVLIIYLLFILLVEGEYVHNVFKTSSIKWNF